MKIAKLHDRAILPSRKNPTDAGLDLFSIENIEMGSLDTVIIHTGITIEIPKGCMGFIHAKSKSNYLIGGGIVDESYQGEILVKVINTDSKTRHINKGQAIAQLIIVPILTPEVEEVTIEEIHQKETSRGKTGGIVTQTGYIIKEDATIEEVSKFWEDKADAASIDPAFYHFGQDL